jgi:hypothetical protein
VATLTLNEFVALHDGHVVPFGGYTQCVALVETYCIEVLDIPVVWANAIDWWSKDANYLTWTRNVWGDPLSKPPVGAIVVWGPSPRAGTGPDGHLAICTDSGDGLHFTSFDQNWPEHSPARHVVHDYWGVIGWGVTPLPPVSPQPPMRTMYDSTNPLDIPTTAVLVAGYIDGRWGPDHLAMGEPTGWDGAGWARFLRSQWVKIAVHATTNDGHVLDVENGNATPEEAVTWVRQRRAALQDPSVYMNANTWPQVQAAFRAVNEPEPHYWVAAWQAGDSTIPPGAVARQYANPTITGAHYDLSAVVGYWPGVDPPLDPCGAVKTALAAEQARTHQLEDHVAQLTAQVSALQFQYVVQPETLSWLQRLLLWLRPPPP